MKTLLLLISLITFDICLGQSDTQITIIGKILTTKNVPLANTIVLDTKTKLKTRTNLNGDFQLIAPKQSTSIQFSYIGYQTIAKDITLKDIEKVTNDTIYITVTLNQKTNNLEGFEFNSDKIKLAYKEKHISIIDYDFHPKGLLLLISLNKEYRLRLVDFQSNIISDLKLPKKPQKIFKDCLDERHILYKDSSFQIYEANEKLKLMEAFAIDKFNLIMNPCITSSVNSLFFESYGAHNQSVIYYSINKNDQQRKLIHIVSSKESQMSTDMYYKEAILQSQLAVHIMGDNSIREQEGARDAEENTLFYETILNQPIYNPLFKFRDSIYVFDHIKDSIYICDYDKTRSRALPIDYQYKRGWKKEIIIDYYNAEVYAKMIRDGITYLMQINMDNGQIMSEYKLDRHIFVDNIKIQDGFAYYLFKDRNDGSIQRVYKQRLN